LVNEGTTYVFGQLGVGQATIQNSGVFAVDNASVLGDVNGPARLYNESGGRVAGNDSATGVSSLNVYIENYGTVSADYGVFTVPAGDNAAGATLMATGGMLVLGGPSVWTSITTPHSPAMRISMTRRMG
jgi:hypothetical protein